MSQRRLGLVFSSAYRIEDTLEAARLADESGFDCIWVPEATARDGFTYSAKLLSETERLKVGPGIINVYSRTPTVIAMSAATVAELFPGRFMLGLGASNAEMVRAERPDGFARPLTRVREATEIIQRALSGQPFSFSGREFRLPSFKPGFEPPGKKVPIYLAALKEKMARLAGEIADGVLLYFHPPELLRTSVQNVGEAASKAGRDRSQVATACFITTCISQDREAASRAARMAIAQFASISTYGAHLSAIGYGREVERIVAAVKKEGVREAASFVTDQMVDSLAIVGDIEACARQLDLYYSTGLELPLLRLYTTDGDVKATLVDSVRALATVLR